MHRLVWGLLIGPPPPLLHHECPNKRCCYPEHLEPHQSRVTHNQRHRLIFCRSGKHVLPERGKPRVSRGRPYEGRDCPECKREWARAHPERMAAASKRWREKKKHELSQVQM